MSKRYCRAEIYFLYNPKSGRSTPVDIDPDPRGNLIISLEDGQCRASLPSAPIIERHTNHMGTCSAREE
jgi:hypothetical protein